MGMEPVPVGFSDTGDWILHYIYGHPKESHSTQSLFQQLASALKAGPSQIDDYYKRGSSIDKNMTDEEYEAVRYPKLSTVQKAVETLRLAKWIRGKRNADDQDVVFFSGLNLTGNGEIEAIQRKRKKEEKEKSLKR